jgi:hypothetical protein
MLWNNLNNFDNMLHVTFDVLLSGFFVMCVCCSLLNRPNPTEGWSMRSFLDIWAIKLFTWNCVIITSLLFCKPVLFITHRTNRGESFDLLLLLFPCQMYILLHLTDKNQQCCFVCLLVSHWKAQLNVILLTIGSQVYRFCATGIWQNKFAFVFNNHVLLPVTRSELTWNVSELVRLQGCSFITLLSWLTTKFSHQNLFRHVLMRNWGSVCHSWFDFSVSVAHLRCCVSTIGRRGGLLFVERNSSQWSQWYFYDFKEMPVWGWSRNSLL